MVPCPDGNCVWNFTIIFSLMTKKHTVINNYEPQTTNNLKYDGGNKT